MADAEAPISEREIEVLRLVATGATNQEIARELIISVNTVKVHLRNIFEKLGVQSRTEATLYAIRQGWVVLDGVELTSAESTAELPIVPTAAVTRPGPVAGWQRAYALAALLLAAALLVLPTLPREAQGATSTSPISDRPAEGSASLQAATSRWTVLADLPAPRTRLALAAHDEMLYAIGGDRQAGVTGAVEIYSIENNSWSSGAPKPIPVANVGAAVLGDRIYVPGGCIGLTDLTAQMEVYSPADDAWSQAAELPFPLCAYALATVADKIYLFGGWDGERFVDVVLAYDPRTDTWTRKKSVPAPRGFAAAASIEGTVYLIGGYDGVQEFADVFAYDAARDIWSEQAPMSAGRGGLGAAVIGNKLYAIGGGWQNYLVTNERYDPSSDTWTAFESPVLGEWRNLGVASWGNQVYAVGGWNGDLSGANQAYQAIFRIILPLAR